MRKNARLPRVLGRRIRKRRKEIGLTQEELAYKVGVSRSYMGYLEQARNVPSLKVLDKIGKVLKIKISELLR